MPSSLVYQLLVELPLCFRIICHLPQPVFQKHIPYPLDSYHPPLTKLIKSQYSEVITGAHPYFGNLTNQESV